MSAAALEAGRRFVQTANFLESLDIVLDAVFLWKIPFVTPLLNRDTVAFKRFPASAVFSSAALRYFFTDVLTLDLYDMFLRRFFSFCLILFKADG